LGKEEVDGLFKLELSPSPKKDGSDNEHRDFSGLQI
jgi:hypothetical protein